MKYLLSFVAFSISVSYAGTSSIVEPMTVWPKTEVTVCFGTQDDLARTALPDTQMMIPYTAHEKEVLKSAVNNEFTPEATGIHFVGWEDCRADLKPDAILFAQDSERYGGGGQASMGYHGEKYDEGYRSLPQEILDEKGWSTYVLLRTGPSLGKLTDDQRLSYIGLHEFGHLAGLRHEHIRPEAKDDWICKLTGDADGLEQPGKLTSYTGKYDPISIMSYCFNTFMAEYAGLSFQEKDFQPLPAFDPKRMSRSDDGTITMNIGLSSLDQHALRCLYTYSPEVKAAICHP
jgi:hypothetical protein